MLPPGLCGTLSIMPLRLHPVVTRGEWRGERNSEGKSANDLYNLLNMIDDVPATSSRGRASSGNRNDDDDESADFWGGDHERAVVALGRLWIDISIIER